MPTIQPSHAAPLPPQAKMGLSEKDVQQLLQARSSETRLGVLKSLAQSYGGGGFTDKEQAIAEQIFRHMARDTESKVRIALSNMLQSEASVPRDIVLQLAMDQENDVALPMIAHASLSDYDLVNIVEMHSNDTSRLVAVAQRPVVTERVSNALIETRQADAVLALASNSGARISERSYLTILSTFRSQSALMAELARREHLPLAISEQLISHVSEQLKTEWSGRYRLYENEVSEQTQQVRESATLQLLDDDPSVDAHHTLIHHLIEKDKLTPTLILQALCRGNLLFFEMALATMANIPLHNAQLLLHDPGGLGYARLCARANLPPELTAASQLLLSVVKTLNDDAEIPGTPRHAVRAERMLLERAGHTEYGTAPSEPITQMLTLIRMHGQAAA